MLHTSDHLRVWSISDSELRPYSYFGVVKYFISPDPSILASLPSDYIADWLTEFRTRYPEAAKKLKQDSQQGYSEYNYSGSGLASRIKLHHMEVALAATTHLFHNSNAIDMGCADGIFMPSLSKYFDHVAGVDVNPKLLDYAKLLCEKHDLDNVRIHTNSMDLKAKLNKHPFHVLYCLEVLEHIGTTGATMYDEKISFVNDSLQLLEQDGIMVITVPKMVGPSFLLQRLGLFMLGIVREPITLGNLFRAGLLCNTDRMEQEWWPNGHMGFNHRKLQQLLYKHFQIVKRKSLMFQMLYIVKLK